MPGLFGVYSEPALLYLLVIKLVIYWLFTGWGALGRVAFLPGDAVICALHKERDKPSTPAAAACPVVLGPYRDAGALEYRDPGRPLESDA